METSRSLLHHLKNSDDAGWERFVGIYMPIVERWLKRSTVPGNDVADLQQEILLALTTALPNFEHNGRVGAFRSWLKQITLNRCRRYWESRKKRARVSQSCQEMLDALEDPGSPMSQIWNRDHDQHVFKVLLNAVRGDFSERTIQIFRRVAIQGVSAQIVAEEFGAKVGHVYKAKFRVMSRLQEEAQRLVDSVCSIARKGGNDESN